MTSERKIEANRRNARKSSGPKTQAGKDKVRFNAVKHGLTAKTVVLPHEDAEAYQQRVEAWTRELNPRGDLGRYLAERAARISWQLDRADAYEHACLSQRVRHAGRAVIEGPEAEAVALLERLYGSHESQASFEPNGSGPLGGHSVARGEAPAVLSPSALVGRLETTAAGCRLVLGEWVRLRDKVSQVSQVSEIATSEPAWDWDDLTRAVRLLGLGEAEARVAALLDRRLGPLARAQAEVHARECRRLLETGVDDEDFPDSPRTDKPEPPLSFDPAELNRQCAAIAEEQCLRLTPILARREADERADRADLPRRSSFDDSPEGERVHRYQARWSRNLLRTLAAVEELREQEPEEPEDEEQEEEIETLMPPAISSISPQPDLDDSTRTEREGEAEGVEENVRNKANGEYVSHEDVDTCVESAGGHAACATAAVAVPGPVPAIRADSTLRAVEAPPSWNSAAPPEEPSRWLDPPSGTL